MQMIVIPKSSQFSNKNVGDLSCNPVIAIALKATTFSIKNVIYYLPENYMLLKYSIINTSQTTFYHTFTVNTSYFITFCTLYRENIVIFKQLYYKYSGKKINTIFYVTKIYH